MRKVWRTVVTFSLAVTVTTATAAALSNSGGPAVGEGQPPGDSGAWYEEPIGPGYIHGAPCSPDQTPEECTYGPHRHSRADWSDPYGGVVVIEPGKGWAEPVPGHTVIVDPGPGRGSPGYNPDDHVVEAWAVEPPHPCPDGVCHTLAPVWATEDLARRLGAPTSAVTVVSVGRVDWPDGSLGDPQSGYAYTDAIVPGYLIRLEAFGKVYVYHTDMHGTVKMVSGA